MKTLAHSGALAFVLAAALGAAGPATAHPRHLEARHGAPHRPLGGEVYESLAPIARQPEAPAADRRGPFGADATATGGPVGGTGS